MSNIIFLNAWFMSFVMVVYGVLRLRSRRELFMWVPATVLFGPFGAIIFGLDVLAQWQQRHPRQTKTIDTYQQAPLHSTVALHTLHYLYVKKGANSNVLKAIKLPSNGILTVRRGHKNERCMPNEFLLHDQTVSRNLHCSIHVQYHGMVLEDASTNGTYVNGVHVHHRSVPIAVGTELRLGETILIVKSAADIASTIHS